MKNTRFSVPQIIILVSMIVIVITGVLILKDRARTDDIKNKLTLINGAKKVPALSKLIEKNLAEQEKSAAVSSSDNVLSQKRVYTEQEIAQMSESDFTHLLEEIKKRLPKKSDLKAIPPGALHRTPPIIIEAGHELGLIKEVLTMHESFVELAVPFYKACAKDVLGTTPVRALCLTNLIEIKKKNGQDLNMSEFPQNIIDLAKMVTDL